MPLIFIECEAGSVTIGGTEACDAYQAFDSAHRGLDEKVKHVAKAVDAAENDHEGMGGMLATLAQEQMPSLRSEFEFVRNNEFRYVLSRKDNQKLDELDQTLKSYEALGLGR